MFFDHTLKKIERIAGKVDARAGVYQKMTDGDLKKQTEILRSRLKSGETMDDILPDAFAVCREADARVLGKRPYHVQVLGGIALHQGRIAEMKTGEGKTLAATMPAYLNALEGKGVHIITVNDYLASRDAEQMGMVYSYLGLSCCFLDPEADPYHKKLIYDADIVYGTNSSFGFDYLRDNLVTNREQILQRGLHYAIIDEVDSILIDEARTPLIIAEKGDNSEEDAYRKASAFVKSLTKDEYSYDEKEKQVSLTDAGVKKAEAVFDVENLADVENTGLNHYIVQSLNAQYTKERDVDYIVANDQIIIVDEFTGRPQPDRRFSEGLHQALEAKEGVTIRAENVTTASITLQNLFRMYDKLSGMTGTAKTEEDEFREIYNMDVVVIPTNRENIRKDDPDAVYTTAKGKWKAAAEKIREIHETGQPVLAGTATVENSEILSRELKKLGVPHRVLNARSAAEDGEREAAVVAQAGKTGAVTIATNMAGRGTDILLGGNPEFEARELMLKEGFTPEQIAAAETMDFTSEEDIIRLREIYDKHLEKAKKKTNEDHERVKKLGGLFIIGTERHESRRVDNQLRGRAGRQGDPGETKFYVSLEDEIMTRFGGEALQQMAARLKIGEGEAIEGRSLTKAIENAQKKMEGYNFGIRKNVLQYDNVLNQQRRIIYEQRRKVLMGENMDEEVRQMIRSIASRIAEDTADGEKYPENWDLEKCREKIRSYAPNAKIPELDDEEALSLSEKTLSEAVSKAMIGALDEYESMLGELLYALERAVILSTVDFYWREHMDIMDQLRKGIGLRAIGQMDPAAEYAREGYALFGEMNEKIRSDIVRSLLGISVGEGTVQVDLPGNRAEASSA